MNKAIPQWIRNTLPTVPYNPDPSAINPGSLPEIFIEVTPDDRFALFKQPTIKLDDGQHLSKGCDVWLHGRGKEFAVKPLDELLSAVTKNCDKKKLNWRRGHGLILAVNGTGERLREDDGGLQGCTLLELARRHQLHWQQHYREVPNLDLVDLELVIEWDKIDTSPNKQSSTHGRWKWWLRLRTAIRETVRGK